MRPIAQHVACQPQPDPSTESSFPRGAGTRLDGFHPRSERARRLRPEGPLRKSCMSKMAAPGDAYRRRLALARTAESAVAGIEAAIDELLSCPGA